MCVPRIETTQEKEPGHASHIHRKTRGKSGFGHRCIERDRSVDRATPGGGGSRSGRQLRLEQGGSRPGRGGDHAQRRKSSGSTGERGEGGGHSASFRGGA